MSERAVERGYTVSELAARLGGRVRGEGGRRLYAIAVLDEATGDELSWLGSPRYADAARRSAAGAILVPPGYEPPTGQTLIEVDSPDDALVAALAVFQPTPEAVAAGVHPSAVVDPSARLADAAIGPHCSVSAGVTLGPGVVLHAGVHLCRDVEVGAGSVLWHNVVVREGCRIGARVTIHPNATIGADGFSYILRDGRHVRIPQIGNVVIEDDVEIGAGTAIDRARSGATRIRRGAKIDNLVQVGHNCDIGEHAILVGQVGISGSCRLGAYVVLGGQVGVADHVEIGERTQVAAQSGVNRNVGAGLTLRGTPVTDITKFARQEVALRRLPRLIEQVRELTKRIERLEATTDDRG